MTPPLTPDRLAAIEAKHRPAMECRHCDRVATAMCSECWQFACDDHRPDFKDTSCEGARWIPPRLTGDAGDALDLVAEVRRLRAILDGRTEPPTRAEVAAHGNGGIEIARWRFAWAVPGGAETVGVVSRDGVRDAVQRYPGARWWPLDARDNPCPWPAAP